jgi:major membrane immunogen (membrane-anchored lipoprotein)
MDTGCKLNNFTGATMTQGTYAGLRAVFVRHYAGNMIEIRVPGGLIVVDRQHFLC